MRRETKRKVYFGDKYMKKVILIGGSPMVGKSTAAISLAAKLAYPCISTDDIGEVLQTVTDISPMRGHDYLDYYTCREKAKLIEDITDYHKKMEPAIRKLAEIHSAWGNPLIIEGYALYPDQFKEQNGNVFSVWLIADKHLLENRLNSNTDFYKNAKDPEKGRENYLYRSEWHNEKIFEQCKAGNQNYIIVKQESTTEEIASCIMDMLNGAA
jgi:2-phosphoglycerate kinase